ncbi:MAG: carboxypeptidase regulatory-like domain-containing protein [Planctomycetales bacterium]|nr:carboxypeptidase regulatory-like domain-containing protein [Planctomycetales bacterium]
MKIKTSWLLCAAGLLGFMVGCGPDLSHLPKTVKAEGTVTLDGIPVDQATVVFIAQQGQYSARAITDASGKFTLQAFDEKPGAVPGDYKIQVNKTVLNESGGGSDPGAGGTVQVSYGLPKRYAAISTSGLKYTIPDQDTSDILLELKSK